MNCPRCNNELTEVTKHGIAIDNCTSCGGIWLDKGELAKIINEMRKAEAALDEEFRSLRPERKGYHEKSSSHGHDEHSGTYKHRKGFRGLFDIFD
jgi:uncharacterized protein